MRYTLYHLLPVCVCVCVLLSVFESVLLPLAILLQFFVPDRWDWLNIPFTYVLVTCMSACLSLVVTQQPYTQVEFMHEWCPLDYEGLSVRQKWRTVLTCAVVIKLPTVHVEQNPMYVTLLLCPMLFRVEGHVCSLCVFKKPCSLVLSPSLIQQSSLRGEVWEPLWGHTLKERRGER